MGLITRQDLRSALRSLRRSPAFVLVAVISLGLAIALNTTMFSIVDALLYPQYPFADQSELYRIGFVIPPAIGRNCAARSCSQSGRAVISEANHHAMTVMEHASFFRASARETYAFGLNSTQLDMPGASTVVRGARVITTNYFDIIGVKPYLGRFFFPNETEAADRRYVVISYSLWRRLFNDRKTFEPFGVTFGGGPYLVIGVLPPRSELGLGAEFFATDNPYRNFYLSEIIRARPGATRAAIDADLNRLNVQLAREWGTNPIDSRYEVEPVIKSAKPVNDISVALTAAVVAVLLIACFNVANLQLARGLGRARELAVRAALGASRVAIVRLLVLESAIVAVVGTGMGMMLALWGAGAVRSSVPVSIAGLGYLDTQISWRVFAWAAVALILTIVTSGLLPAIRVSRANIDELIKSGAGTSVTKGARRQYSWLIVGEIAGALVLFAGASLLLSAARQLHTFDMGYDGRQLIWSSATFASPAGGRPPSDQARAMLDAVRARPEVASATLMRTGGYDSSTVSVDDPTRPRAQFRLPPMESAYNIVSADFFRTFGIRILRGSDFALNDDGRIPSVIIDSTAAARWWPGVDPVGRMIKLGPLSSAEPWIRVTGIARAARFYATEDDPAPQVFLLTSGAGAYTSRFNPGMRFFGAAIVARVKGDPEQFLVTLRQHYGGYVRLRVAQVWEVVSGLRALQRSHDFIAAAFVAFALFGLALAVIGIYGVIAHSVAQRTREFGVRFALGADARDVQLMVIREGHVVTLVGLAVGLLVTYWGIGLIQFYLFGVEPSLEAVVLTTAPIVLYAAATLASWAPALRASRVDPIEALRNE